MYSVLGISRQLLLGCFSTGLTVPVASSPFTRSPVSPNQGRCCPHRSLGMPWLDGQNPSFFPSPRGPPLRTVCRSGPALQGWSSSDPGQGCLPAHVFIPPAALDQYVHHPPSVLCAITVATSRGTDAGLAIAAFLGSSLIRAASDRLAPVSFRRRDKSTSGSPHSSRAAPSPLTPCRRGFGVWKYRYSSDSKITITPRQGRLHAFPLSTPTSTVPVLSSTHNALALPRTSSSLFLPSLSRNQHIVLPPFYWSWDITGPQLSSSLIAPPPERTGSCCIRLILACLSPGGAQVRTRRAVHSQGTRGLVAPAIDNH
ncbi:hypothetical protein VUR80DRAFT_1238 [Thermomyces stellatus]